MSDNHRLSKDEAHKKMDAQLRPFLIVLIVLALLPIVSIGISWIIKLAQGKLLL